MASASARDMKKTAFLFLLTATAMLVRAEDGLRKVVCYGSSLLPDGAYAKTLQFELDRRWEGKFVVWDDGIGRNSGWGLANLQSRVIDERADAVFLEFATNDAIGRERLDLRESEANLTAIVERLRAALPDADIVLLTMNPRTDATADFPSYCDACRRVAETHGLKLVDLYPIWEDFRRKDSLGYAECVPDGVHPNDLGVRRVVMPRLLDHFLSAATSVGLEDLRREVLDGKWVSVSGYLREAFEDELATNRLIAVFKYASESAYLTFRGGREELARLQSLVSARIVVRGKVSSSDRGGLPFEGPRLENCLLDDVEILEAAPSDVYSAKLLESTQPADPKHLDALLRRRLLGEVRAVWGRKFLLRDAGAPFYSASPGGFSLRPVGRLHVIELAPDVTPPRSGSSVETVGFPATDLHGVNFLSAVWREKALPGDLSAVERPRSEDPSPGLNGELLTFAATVADIARERTPELIVTAPSGDVCVPVDACPDVCERVAVGSRVALTGICVAERENWHGHSSYPRLKRLLLVPRGGDDVVILNGPSWWTPARLLAVIGGLLLLVVALSVKWVIDRRIARARFADRTRLAVELHDSVSQNLTGVSLQIDAARELVATSPERLVRRLDIASRTIDSCREQMRNCIGDLRGNMLDCDDFNRAIREILAPILHDTCLQVRFNVPRKLLSDGSAHAIFSIVRELAANAVRHGKASSVRIAGTMDKGCLHFSVSDDGVGFDPDRRPGIEEGHFGLQGVSERVRALNGRLAVESQPGKGTRISVVISNLRGA